MCINKKALKKDRMARRMNLDNNDDISNQIIETIMNIKKINTKLKYITQRKRPEEQDKQ